MIHARKSLGQHFLMHPQIASRIADAAALVPNATVFEVGPGTGILTKELIKRAKNVIAVEADSKLVEKLRRDFANEIADGRLELIHGDIRTFDLATLPQKYALVANIPYYLTGELFRKFLEAENQPLSMTLLVQKEVAERIARSKKESVLSLSVKAYGEPEYEFTVPRGAFRPPPKVDSAVLSIRNISRSRFSSLEHEKRFFTLIHAGFAHKRKVLAGNLKGLVSIEELRDADIPEDTRAEDVPLEVWLLLSEPK